MKLTLEQVLSDYTKIITLFMPVFEKLLIDEKMHPFVIYYACMSMSKGFKEYAKALCADDKEFDRILAELEKSLDKLATDKLFPRIRDALDRHV